MRQRPPNTSATRSGTSTGYKVEARMKPTTEKQQRYSGFRPVQISEHQWLSEQWQEIHFEAGFNPAGIPLDRFIPFNEEKNYLRYEGAVALAWTLIAQLGYGAFEVECRIVRYHIKYEIYEMREGVVDSPVITQGKYSDEKLIAEESATAEGARGEP